MEEPYSYDAGAPVRPVHERAGGPNVLVLCLPGACIGAWDWVHVALWHGHGNVNRAAHVRTRCCQCAHGNLLLRPLRVFCVPCRMCAVPAGSSGSRIRNGCGACWSGRRVGRCQRHCRHLQPPWPNRYARMGSAKGVCLQTSLGASFCLLWFSATCSSGNARLRPLSSPKPLCPFLSVFTLEA